MFLFLKERKKAQVRGSVFALSPARQGEQQRLHLRRHRPAAPFPPPPERCLCCLAFQKQDGKGAEETFRDDARGVYLDCGSDYVTLFPKLIDLNT